jgi:hypothetical protein
VVELPTPIRPSPPAADTAAASLPPDRPAMGAPTTGTSIESISVSDVRSMGRILAAPWYCWDNG